MAPLFPSPPLTLRDTSQNRVSQSTLEGLSQMRWGLVPGVGRLISGGACWDRPLTSACKSAPGGPEQSSQVKWPLLSWAHQRRSRTPDCPPLLAGLVLHLERTSEVKLSSLPLPGHTQGQLELMTVGSLELGGQGLRHGAWRPGLHRLTPGLWVPSAQPLSPATGFVGLEPSRGHPAILQSSALSVNTRAKDTPPGGQQPPNNPE